MRIPAALSLMAVGGILADAVEFELPGIDVNALGSILFFVGLLGLVIAVWLEVAAIRARRPPRAAPPRPRPAARPAREAPYDPIVGPPRRREPPPGGPDAPTRVLPRDRD